MHINVSIYVLRQCLLGFVGILDGLNTGLIFAFTSIFFPQIKQEDSFLLNTSIESWLASAPVVLLAVSSLICGFIMEKIGRKLTLLLAEILALICWIVIYVGRNYTTILIARFLCGIHMAIQYTVVITFIGEISQPQYRTIFLSSLCVGTTFGTFLCQYVGVYLNWKLISLIFSVFPLCNIIISIYLRESYVTLLDRDKMEKARYLFEWYQGNTQEAKHVFDRIINDKKQRKRQTLNDTVKLCLSKSFLIPFSITTVIYLTNEVTATQAVIFYTSQIIGMINNDEVFQFYATLALNLLRILASILGLFLVKISTLRFILLSTGYCLGLSLLLLAVFMYLSETYVNNSIFPILSLITLVMNTVLYYLGLGPLPSVVCGEMFPVATRSIGGSVCSAISFVFLFIVVKFIPVLLTNIGPYWTFGIFGICTLVGISISHLLLPTTKNKTLLEINMMYNNQPQVEQ